MEMKFLSCYMRNLIAKVETNSVYKKLKKKNHRRYCFPTIHCLPFTIYSIKYHQMQKKLIYFINIKCDNITHSQEYFQCSKKNTNENEIINKLHSHKTSQTSPKSSLRIFVLRRIQNAVLSSIFTTFTFYLYFFVIKKSSSTKVFSPQLSCHLPKASLSSIFLMFVWAPDHANTSKMNDPFS